MLEILQLAALISAPALMVFAASYDVFTMTIPNRISLFMTGMFVVAALLLGMSLVDTAMHFAIAFIVLAVGIGMFAAGWVGGGDVKFAAATTLWMGFGFVLEYIFVSALAGGALTLLILAFRRLPLPATAQGWTWLDRLHNPKNGVPYGVALAFGGLVIFPRSPLWSLAFPL
jgi:prepilin peptidase CpaA